MGERRSKLAVAAAAALGLLAPMAVGVGAAHADSNSGYVIGTVKDNTGRALPGADVEVWFCQTNDPGGGVLDPNGCYDTWDNNSESTDRNGRYVADLSKYYDLQEFPNATVAGHWLIQGMNYLYTDAAPVAVAPQNGVNVAGPNFVLAPDPSYVPPAPGSYTITGVVTDFTGAPATNGSVTATNATTNDYEDSDSIRPDGHYYLNVTSGTPVKIKFNRTGSAFSFYGGTQARTRAAVVTAPAAATPAVANGTVGALGTITGALKLPSAGPNWEAWATVYDANGNGYDDSNTDAAGNFSIDVEPGTYFVRGDGDRFTEAPDPGTCPTCVQEVDSFGFVAGWFGKKATSLFDAQKVVVGPNGNVSVGTITLGNTLHSTVKPVIKAKKGVKKGAKLSVSTGTWNDQVRATYTYAWKVGHKTVGTSAKLKLNKKVWKKVGKKVKKLTVTVTATDKYGEFVNGSVKLKVLKTLAKQAKATKNS